MKIDIKDTDHARLTALADERGDADVSNVLTDALDTYYEVHDREGLDCRKTASNKGRWIELARRYRKNPNLSGHSEKVNDLFREFRNEFSL